MLRLVKRISFSLSVLGIFLKINKTLAESTRMSRLTSHVHFELRNRKHVCQQLLLVLCFHQVIETGILTNQRAYFLRTVF